MLKKELLINLYSMNTIFALISNFTVQDLSTCPLGVTKHIFKERWTVLQLTEVPGVPNHLFIAIQDYVTMRQYTWRSCRTLLLLQRWAFGEIPETMYRDLERSSYRFRTFSESNEPLIIGYVQKPARFPNLEDYNEDLHRVSLDYRDNSFVLDFINMLG